jgi:multicomponent Na+:H+ antiporter subunit B
MNDEGLSLIVKNITRLLSAFILAYGVYIVLYGHVTPGGGFTGGVILAAGLVLVILAFGRKTTSRMISEQAAAVADSLGALGFLLVALLGYLSAELAGYFTNFLPKGNTGELLSAGAIPISNLAIGVKVGAALFGVVLALAGFRFASQKHKEPTP